MKKRDILECLVSTSDLERRAFTMSELRVETRDGKPLIEGHAAVFNQKADIFGFTEEVAPGAFRDSIGTDDIRALFNHDSNFVLGRNRSKTLELAEDERGLFISNRPPETQWARDLLVSIERGDINQMSFGFRTLEDAWQTVDGVPHRTLKRVQLFDVSPVTFPAYPQTDVGVAMRSMGHWLKRESGAVEAAAQGEAEAIAAAGARERELQLKLLGIRLI
jgi:HK97 family phage prohead protease